MNRERRLLPSSRVEVREGEGDNRPRIVGHASVFDRWTTLYDSKRYRFSEVVRPGAFARAIKEGQDVRSLFNHDSNFVLGRTSSGTLVLSEDAVGLYTETFPSDSQTVRDLVLTPIRRKDITGMSFAFLPNRGGGTRTREEKPDGSVVITTPGERITFRRENDKLIEERELTDVDLYDISPVTYPAYPDTDVSMRSMEARHAEAMKEFRYLMDIKSRYLKLREHGIK